MSGYERHAAVSEPSLEHAPLAPGRQRKAVLGLVMLAVLLLPLLLWLGFWQLDRAAEKAIILDQIEQRPALPPLGVSELADDRAEWRHRRARLIGRYHPTYQWLLDNRIHDGQPGYEVLSAFHLTATDQWILVNRGWLPAPMHRDQLPALPLPAGQQQLEGRVDTLTTPGLRLSEPPVATGWPKRIQSLEREQLQAQLSQPLLPWQVRLEPEQAGGLVPRPVQIPAGPDMHRGYAVQWFGLALVLLVGSIIAVVRILKESR